MDTELTKYIRAFGDVQAKWIENALYPELTIIDNNMLLNEYVPVRLQNWYARRTGIAVVRSLIPGGHRLTVVKRGRVLSTTNFKLTENDWVREEVSNA